MKNAVIVIVVALLGTAAYFTTSLVMEQRAKVAQAVAQKSKMDKARAEAEAKKAQEERLAKERETVLVASRIKAAKEEQVAKRAAAEADRAKREADNAAEKRAATEKAATDAKRALAAEETRKHEMQLKAETEAKERAAVELKAKNEGRQVAEVALMREQMAAKRAADELKAQELKKKQYETLYAETLAVKRQYDQRLEELKPAKTIQDLIAENDTAEAAAPKRNTGPVAGNSVSGQARTPQRVLREKTRTAADDRIDEQEAKIERIGAEGKAANTAQIVARLERLFERALCEKRAADAEYYLANLKILVPGYEYEGKRKKE